MGQPVPDTPLFSQLFTAGRGVSSELNRLYPDWYDKYQVTIEASLCTSAAA